MKKKLIKKLMTAIAVAGSLLAGTANSLAQTDAPAPRPAPSNADGSVSDKGVTTPIAPGTKPADGSVAPGSEPNTQVPAGDVTILPYPYPLPDTGTGGIVPPRLPSDRPAERPKDGSSVRPRGPTEPDSGDSRRGNVVLVGRPATRTSSDETVRILPVSGDSNASDSGVVVFSGDIVRVVPGESTSVGSLTSSPVLAVVQQFDAQRTEALAARATALEQLRTATPQERESIIADLQTATRAQAAERREAARELRNEMRALREARKGGN